MSDNREDWAFEEPQNVATISLRRIFQGGQPILFVTHDAEDGTWQFLDGQTVEVEDAMLVALKEVVRLDPTVAALADLLLGWQATRADVQSPWVRRPQPPTPPEPPPT